MSTSNVELGERQNRIVKLARDCGIDHKARKDHRCSACFQPIIKGETYRTVNEHIEYVRFPITHKVCPRCLTNRYQKDQLLALI